MMYISDTSAKIDGVIATAAFFIGRLRGLIDILNFILPGTRPPYQNTRHQSMATIEQQDEEKATASPKPSLNHDKAKTQPLLPEHPSFLWSTSQSAHESGELRFSGFEPCYIACIRDLEHQIKLKIQNGVKSYEENPGMTTELAPLLLQYSNLLSALSKVESRDRVFEEDQPEHFQNHDVVTVFSGSRRRITRPSSDSDRLHSHLRDNLILVVLGYIYNWDVADKLKRRFGNLSTTLDRLLVGLGGGAALLVPMIMMTFLTTRTARLIIVSVATMLFATVMALSSNSRESVIGATAAYAAIMVVYIGSSEFT